MTIETRVIKYGTIVCGGGNTLIGAEPTESDIESFLNEVEVGFKAVAGNENTVVQAYYGGINPNSKTQNTEGAPIWAKAVATLIVIRD